jgi:hypothetical protein
MTLADTLSLTQLEWARVAVVVGVRNDQLGTLLRAVTSGQGTPEELEQGTAAMYGIALQLERRLDRSLTWADAETWAVAIRDDAEALELAEAEDDAVVQAAIVTGAPVADHAQDVTIGQMAAYGRAHERERARARMRR